MEELTNQNKVLKKRIGELKKRKAEPKPQEEEKKLPKKTPKEAPKEAPKQVMKQAPEEKSISKEERYVCLHDTRKEHCDDSYAYHERSELKLFYDKGELSCGKDAAGRASCLYRALLLGMRWYGSPLVGLLVVSFRMRCAETCVFMLSTVEMLALSLKDFWIWS